LLTQAGGGNVGNLWLLVDKLKQAGSGNTVFWLVVMAKKVKDDSETPLMRQYNEIKVKYPDAILLFRVGDFYETFGEDAVKTAQVLGIVLTRRHNGSASEIELAGFPHHSLDNYLPRLVRAGYRVAVCDQLEDPKLTKKIVKRGVTELVTPGVAYNHQVLDQKQNNFLAAVHIDADKAGVAFADVSTGEFMIGEGPAAYVNRLLQSFQPNEVLFQKQKTTAFHDTFGGGYYTYRLEDWVFQAQYADDMLNRHFGTKSLRGFGVESMSLAIVAAGAIMHYLEDTRHDRLAHITALSRIDGDQYVWLDRFTLRNLEILHSPNEGGKTLVGTLDATRTPMGSRLLRRWLSLPLCQQSEIHQRHEMVEYLAAQTDLRYELQELLQGMGDLERLVSRVAAMKCSPREMLQVARALERCFSLKIRVQQEFDASLRTLVDRMPDCSGVSDKIAATLHPDAPSAIGKGETVAAGVHPELDELRVLRTSGKDYLKQLLERETAKTGISSLKIGYNNVFGYYLEVRNAAKDKVPEDWIRKQTLTQAERYITEELKEYETKILGAEEKILAIEQQVFQELTAFVSEFVAQVQQNAAVVAQVDCLAGFAEVAQKNGYCRPVVDDSMVIDIKGGRHPVIEMLMPPGQKYVDNDVFLDTESQQILMITGPNMSGKSALLRQTALIALMAQAGSFVPATSARIGLVDKIFTRVGASDNLSAGESTFMVEMTETASILNNLSPRSLILLDEIGRGTSTYDGISIAWAIAEYLHQNPKYHPRTLFATHYHELNEMAEQYSRIRNFNVSIKEAGNRILFMRKLEPGGTNHSFGIHVARMAGMPVNVIERANQVLTQLEGTHVLVHNGKPTPAPVRPVSASNDMQLSFFQLDDPVLQDIRDQIKGLDINNLTPVEALMKLNEIKRITGL
jgi:DNA mismatch repair protein MutS